MRQEYFVSQWVRRRSISETGVPSAVSGIQRQELKGPQEGKGDDVGRELEEERDIGGGDIGDLTYLPRLCRGVGLADGR